MHAFARSTLLSHIFIIGRNGADLPEASLQAVQYIAVPKNDVRLGGGFFSRLNRECVLPRGMSRHPKHAQSGELLVG